MRARITFVGWALIAITLAVPGRVVAGPELCAVEERAAGEEPEKVAIQIGADRDRVWLEASYKGLQVRKFTQRGGASITELQLGQDRVVISVSAAGLSAIRNGKQYASDDTGSPAAVRGALASSPAVLHARNLLAHFESADSLNPSEMSLVVALAFVASLTGDTGAPARVGERFGTRGRERILPVRYVLGSCWGDYSNEVNAALYDHASCRYEADQSSGLMEEVLEFACDATWLMRVESAWFEYINCLGIKI